MFTKWRAVGMVAALGLSLGLATTALAQRGRGGQAQAEPQGTGPLRDLHFRFIGPQGNRDISVVGVPGNSMVAYFGAASGGIWKTTDGGLSFQPVFDHQDVSAVGALAIAPSETNIVWAGTGEPSIIRQATSPGDGVYKSTDGGLHWQHMGLEQTGHIASIVINPNDANQVYVCAVGQGYRDQPERGVYKSDDGGKNWTQVLKVNDQTGCSGLSMDAHDPNTLFAGMWQLQIRPWSENSGGPDGGVFVTHNGGASWTKLNGHGLPAAGAPVGKVAVQVAPSDPSRVYALLEEPAEPAFYRSEDYGRTWKLVNRDNRLIGRPPYFTFFAVSPANENLLYFTAMNWSVSIDGGDTLANVQRAGGDLHDVWIDPKNPQRIMTAHDSGGSISLNGGRSWQQVKLPIAQMYHVYTDTRLPYNVFGNRQDDDALEGPSRSLFSAGFGARGGSIGVGEWHAYAGCESGYSVPDPVDQDILWTGCYNGDLTRVNLKTGEARNVSVWPEDSYGGPPSGVRDRWNWTFPIAIAPQDHNQVFVGSQYVYETTNAGQSWTRISPDLTLDMKDHEGNSGGIVGDNLMTFDAETLSSIAPSPVQAGVIWAGTYDGQVQVTQDGGKNWTNVTKNIPNLPAYGEITIVEPSHYAAGTAYISDDLMMMGDYNPYIYKTTDFGRTWTSVAGDIPHSLFSYVHVVREDPVRKGMLYAGTENTIYFSLDDGGHWTPLKNNMPAAPMYWLTIQPQFNDLVIATYGRGIWIVDDISPLRSWDKVSEAGVAHLFQPRDAYRFRRSVLSPESAPNEVVHGENPPYGADLDYYLPAAAKKVTLTIRGNDGKVIRTVAGGVHAGLNRTWWDLGYPAPATPRVLTAPPGMPWVQTGPEGWRPVVAWGGNASAPKVVPGTYQVELSVDGTTVGTEPLTVHKDPAASGTPESMAAQLKMSLEIQGEINETVGMINDVESTRRQLEDAVKVLEQHPGSEAAIAGDKALEAKFVAIESKLFNVHLTSASIEESFVDAVQLYAKLCTLAGDVNDSGRYGGGASLAPTEQAVALNQILAKQMNDLHSQLVALNQGEGAAFNAQLHGMGLGLGIEFAAPATTPAGR